MWGRLVDQIRSKLKGENNSSICAERAGMGLIFLVYIMPGNASIAARIENLKYEIYLNVFPALESNQII